MAGELRATILATVKGDAAEKLGKQLDGLGGKLKSFGGLASTAVKGVASLGAAIVGSKFIGDSIEQAKNLERSLLGLDSVFGSVAPRMEAFAKGAENIGLSQSEAAKASVFLGSVLQQYGFDANTAAGETEKLTTLAADLAATYGYDVQESLLAITALFRGEYDPIEKFGVAMKQNEINAIRVARGLGDLTGEAEMQADAQIRLELLFQRSTAAQGAMERGAGTLYVETEKLRATFENLQANLGQELIPVFAKLFEELRPIIEDSAPALKEIFEVVADVLATLATTVIDLFDPTTELGSAASNLSASLGSVATASGVAVGGLDEMKSPLEGLIDIMAGLADFTARAIIGFTALGKSAALWADPMKWGEALAFNPVEFIESQTRLLEQGKLEQFYADKVDAILGKQSEVANRAAESMVRESNRYLSFLVGRAASAGVEASETVIDEIGKGLKVAPEPVAAFWAGLIAEVEKQSATVRLESLGASSGLISAILGAGADWKKVFDSIVNGGVEAVKAAQSVFNQTAGGIKEIEEAAKSAKEQLDKLRDAEISRARQSASSNEQSASYYNTYASMLEAGYEKEVAMQVAREEYAMAIEQRNMRQIQQQKELSNAFKQSASDIFNSFKGSGVKEELGEYTMAVRSLGEELNSLITSSESKELFKDGTRRQLTESVAAVTGLMEVVSNARDKLTDELAETKDSLQSQMADRKSLFQGIVDSIMGGVNITEIGGRASTIIRSLTKTLAQTKGFADQITQLRSMGLSGGFLEQIVSAGAVTGGATAKALIAGGPNAIKEVNNLYTQINDVAGNIGTQAADSMYAAGISTTQGLLNGLMSQESALTKVAEELANSFKKAFDRTIASGEVTFSAPSYESILESITSAKSIQSVSGTGVVAGGGGSGVFNITVNAGMGSNGASIGQMIVDEIKRFERQSGRVFISA